MKSFRSLVFFWLPIVPLSCSARGGDPLPALDEIASMAATYHELPQRRDIKFTVPQSHWSKIREALVPAKRDYSAAKWQGLGELTIVTKRGSRVLVWLYFLPEGPGAFAVGQSWDQRAYFRGGDSAKLKQALQAAYAASRPKP